MRNKNEVWKPVVGYENLYEVSNLGRVRSLLSWHGLKERILNPGITKKGYLMVVLSKNRKVKAFKVHRLVAISFLPNPNNLPQVNHKNEVKTDNRVENLEWCDNEYNHNYGTRNERVAKSNINHPNMSKPVICIELNIKFPSTMEAHRQLGINQRNIASCCNGKRNSAGCYHWKYVNE